MEEEKNESAAVNPGVDSDIDDDLVMPPPPVRISVDEWCFHNSMMANRMNIEDVARAAVEMGAEGIGFDYFMMSKEMRANPEPLKEIVQDGGLEVVFGFGVPFALPDIVHQALESKKDEMFDLAHEFNCKVLRVCGGLLIPNMFSKSFHVVLNRGRELKEVAKRLKDFAGDASLEGFTVALENHSDYTMQEMIEILDRVDHEDFKLTLDTGNPVYMKEDPVATAKRLAPFVAYTHIKDVERTGPFLFGAALGDGEVDIPAIVAILRDYNYDGLYSIEVDLPLWKVDKEEESLRKSIDYLRQVEKQY